MPAQSEALRAIELIRKSGLAGDADWTAAHEITQAHEGEPLFDAIHACLHRLEGDHGNAAYWDRRAGTHFGKHGPETELEALEALARAEE